MRWGLLVALAGCNQVYGLDETRLIDASGIGPDAPYACPPLGTAPKFSGTLHSWLNRNCNTYSISATGLAAADCNDSQRIETAPANEPLAMSAGLPTDGNGQYFSQPRMAADGDMLIVERDDFTSDPGSVQLWIFRLAGGTWAHTENFPVTSQYSLATSTISRGPARRLLLLENAGKNLREFEAAGGGWTDLQRSYSTSDLGDFDSFHSPSLSPDGLRLIFWGRKLGVGTGVHYTDRDSVMDRFRIAAPIVGVPSDGNSDAFMTEDCGRIYMSSSGSMYYVQQIPP